MHVGRGTPQGCLIGYLVDDEKQLALAHALPFLHTETDDRSRDLRVNVDVLSSADRRSVGFLKFYGLAHDLHRRIAMRRFVSAACGPAPDERKQQSCR